MVFYNAFLPEITTEDQRDKVSSRGFALGYLGGGLLLALNLALVSLARKHSESRNGMAVRISLLSAGLWWGGFAIITFRRLKTRAAARKLAAGQKFSDRRLLRTRLDLPRAATPAPHAQISDRLSALQRRHPDRHRPGGSFSGAGAVRRARAGAPQSFLLGIYPAGSVRGLRRGAALRADRDVGRDEERDPDLARHLVGNRDLRLWLSSDDHAGVGDGGR